MTKLARKTLADSPMTPAHKRRLAQLAKRPDSQLDFSDIPPAMKGRNYVPPKPQAGLFDAFDPDARYRFQLAAINCKAASECISEVQYSFRVESSGTL
jgi:hypothetical protein